MEAKYSLLIYHKKFQGIRRQVFRNLEIKYFTRQQKLNID